MPSVSQRSARCDLYARFIDRNQEQETALLGAGMAVHRSLGKEHFPLAEQPLGDNAARAAVLQQLVGLEDRL
jgi:hypothetical protein